MEKNTFICPACNGEFDTIGYSDVITCPYCNNEYYLAEDEPRRNSWSFSNIKKHRVCPSCRGSMVYNRKTKLWNCIDCHYQYGN